MARLLRIAAFVAVAGLAMITANVHCMTAEERIAQINALNKRVDAMADANKLELEAAARRPRDDVDDNPLAIHRQPLDVAISEEEPVRLNILMTGLGTDLTGGPLSIMRFAVLAVRAGFRVRWINVDGSGISHATLVSRLKKYHLLESFDEEVEYIHFGRAVAGIPVHPDDMFMATIYYTAFAARATAQLLRNPNIIYFIQDYEPIFFPQNSHWLEAWETYQVPHFAIYSTPFLRNHFASVKESVFSHCNARTCNSLSYAAEPAIIPKPLPATALRLDPALRKPRRLITYARAHAERNAYDLTILALSAAVRAGVFGDEGDWEFIGLGANSPDVPDQCNLGGRQRVCLTIKQNIPEPEYMAIIASADIGFSLMVSPHPSLPPLDFAAAGLVTVTNTFGTKTQEAFSRVSPNIIAVEPSLDSLVRGLKAAVARAETRTQRDITMNWAQDWSDERCYGQQLFKRMHMWFKMQKAVNRFSAVAKPVVSG